MQDILSDLDQWVCAHKDFAIATVINTWGSSPRSAGAKMAVSAQAEMIGSVSGGCVEGAVVAEALQVLEDGQARRLHFGVADETAWEVGLACGGQIDILVGRMPAELLTALRAALHRRTACCLVSVEQGPAEWIGRQIFVTAAESLGSIDADFDGQIVQAAREAIRAGKTGSAPLQGHAAGLSLFFESLLPLPTLVIVGGVHIAIALASLAKTLGYYTIIVDPRRSFGSDARFPHVDELHQLWPDEAFAQITFSESTAVAMLTHDPKIDDPALKIVLESPVFYVGALGSSSTQARRRERLLAEGLSQAQVDRIYGPIGLKLGGRSPEEIALAVMAEIVSVRHSAG